MLNMRKKTGSKVGVRFDVHGGSPNKTVADPCIAMPEANTNKAIGLLCDTSVVAGNCAGPCSAGYFGSRILAIDWNGQFEADMSSNSTNTAHQPKDTSNHSFSGVYLPTQYAVCCVKVDHGRIGIHNIVQLPMPGFDPCERGHRDHQCSGPHP